MINYSQDTFEFKSSSSPEDILNILSSRTLKKKFPVTVITDKDFIGKIDGVNFRIIDSSRGIPPGAACVIDGHVSANSSITITTSLHVAFRILLMVWIVAITVLFVFTSDFESEGSTVIMSFIVTMIIACILFRLFLHWMYVTARNRALKKLRSLVYIP